MTDEQLQAIRDAVDKQVKSSVNGKVDSLQLEFKKLKEDLEPVSDAFKGWRHFRAQATFWIGGILALGGAIQAIQTIWGIVSPYINITRH